MNRTLPLLAALALLLVGPSAASASTRIWAVGDGADTGSTDDQVGEMLGGQTFDYFFYLGDVYETGTAAEFLTNYDPVYGGYKEKTRPTPGNHEWGNHLTGYDPYWGDAYSSPHYYSFDTGGWHVVSLNSEEPSGVGSAQRAWLEADIAQHPGTCTLAFWHKPRYAVASRSTSGSLLTGDPSTAGLWNALAGHASVVLTGHLHNYQRLHEIDGITSLVVGTGGRGGQHYPFVQPPPPSNPASAYLNDTDFGALKLVLGHGWADFSFVDLAGTVKDTGAVACELPPTVRTLTLDASKRKVMKGEKVRLSGAINSPGGSGCEATQTVELQRVKKGTAFKPFTSAVTDAAGAFATRVRVKKTYLYRAEVDVRAACLADTSNTKKVKRKRKK